MFDGGNDGLFDELGMELGDLGGLTMDSPAPKSKSTSTTKDTRNSSSNKNKNNSNNSNNNFDSMDFDLFGDIGIEDGATTKPSGPKTATSIPSSRSSPSNTTAASSSATTTTTTTTTTRRKTKRKTKSTFMLTEDNYKDDDDDDEETASPPSKKKRRTKKAKGSTASSRKDTTSNSGAGSGGGTSTASSKSKSKKGSGAVALARSVSDGPSNFVAAAGQFGGRQHKRTAYTPVSRSSSSTIERPRSSNSKKGAGAASSSSNATLLTPSALQSTVSMSSLPTKKALDATTSSSTVTSSTTTAKRGRSVEVPKPLETSFCGLIPSDKYFFPFLPTLPPEPSMKKCHKHYPMLEKIHSALSTSTTVRPAEEGPLFQLLVGQLESPKQASLLTAIASSRQVVHQFSKMDNSEEKAKLISDFRAVSLLLKRQHDFLCQSLDNMQRWCQLHFSAQDYSAAYGKSKSVLALLKGPIVRLHLVVEHEYYKEPKQTQPLVAQVPISVVKPEVPASTATSKSNKKTKAGADTAATASSSSSLLEPTASAAAVAAASAAAAAAAAAGLVRPPTFTLLQEQHQQQQARAAAVVSYAQLAPSLRRQRLNDKVATHALKLESQHNDALELRRKALDKQHAAMQKVVEEDELVVINTATLWKWMDKAGYFEPLSPHILHDVLPYQVEDPKLIGWEDEVNRNQQNSRQNQGAGKQQVKLDVMDGLMSLLVEEGSDDNESLNDDDDDDDESDLDDWENDDEHDKVDDTEEGEMLDLTPLTLNERAYIHLKAVGLIDDSCPLPQPSTSTSSLPALIEDEVGMGPTKKLENQGQQQNAIGEIDQVLRAMKLDLLRVNKLNNARAHFLHKVVQKQQESDAKRKKKNEKDSELVSKYNQLLKKQKETKRSARQKTNKKDEDWVPW